MVGFLAEGGRMTTTCSVRLALAGALAFGLACQRDTPAPSPSPAPASPQATAPAAPAGAVRQVVLRSVTFGKSINPDGLEVSLGGAPVGSKPFRIATAGSPASSTAPPAAPR
jgi:hypothetical protein